MTEGDAFEREPRTRWLGRRYANNEFSFSPGRENTHALHVRRGRHLAGDRMARSTSGDRGIRADFARSGRTKGERVYTLDGVQHSSQCHVHTRKCTERDEGERPRTARQERWREDWIYGTVPTVTVRNSPLPQRLFALRKELGLGRGPQRQRCSPQCTISSSSKAELMGTYAKTRAKSAWRIEARLSRPDYQGQTTVFPVWRIVAHQLNHSCGGPCLTGREAGTRIQTSAPARPHFQQFRSALYCCVVGSRSGSGRSLATESYSW